MDGGGRGARPIGGACIAGGRTACLDDSAGPERRQPERSRDLVAQRGRVRLAVQLLDEDAEDQIADVRVDVLRAGPREHGVLRRLREERVARQVLLHSVRGQVAPLQARTVVEQLLDRDLPPLGAEVSEMAADGVAER